MAYWAVNREDGEALEGVPCGRAGHDCGSPIRVWGDEYRQCPWGFAHGPHWQSIVTLYNAMQVQPVSDWPDGYAAWIADAVIALHGEFAARDRRELEKARGNRAG